MTFDDDNKCDRELNEVKTSLSILSLSTTTTASSSPLPQSQTSSSLSSLVRSVVDFVDDSGIKGSKSKEKNDVDVIRATFDGSMGEDSIQYIGPPFKDITKFLDEVTEEFELGQLVHLESFGLYDAMSSIEIMDPKMDSGMIFESDINKKAFDPFVLLTPKEVLGVMDRLFICEMTWHSGHSLSQTLYTCLYLDHLDNITLDAFASPDKNDDSTPAELVAVVLKAYILGTVKCCHLVWEEMYKGHVYEEEDFATNRYGKSLCEDKSISDVINLIDTAKQWLDDVGKSWLQNYDQSSAATIAQALNLRLSLRKSFLIALNNISQPQCSQYAAAAKHLQRALMCLNGSNNGIGIRETIEIGIDVECVFDPMINRKLVSQTPPRPIKLLSIEESLNDLDNLLKEVISICGVIEYKSASSLQNYFAYFAARRPAPCAFSRSLLQSTLCTDDRVLGCMSMHQLVKDSVLELNNPPYPYFTSKTELITPGIGSGSRGGFSSSAGGNSFDNTNIHNLLRVFVGNASKPWLNFLRVLCHNRSRQRRNLCKLLSDWDMLQNEAEHIDSELHAITKEEPMNTKDGPSFSFYLSTWVYHQKLVMLEETLFLGFELELYGSHEYMMIYWYLDYILGVHHRHLERMAVYIAGKAAKNKKDHRKSRRKQSRPTPVPPIVSQLFNKQLLLTAKQEICRGVYRMIVALHKSNDWVSPNLEYDNESIRFWNRTKMLRNLGSPTALTYADFKETTRFPDVSPRELLSAALRNFETCRNVIERLNSLKPTETRMELCGPEFKEDMQNMLRVCIGNSTSIQRMLHPSISSTKREAKASSIQDPNSGTTTKRDIVIEFKYHPWYAYINEHAILTMKDLICGTYISAICFRVDTASSNSYGENKKCVGYTRPIEKNVDEENERNGASSKRKLQVRDDTTEVMAYLYQRRNSKKPSNYYITDSDPKTFSHFLHRLYTNEIISRTEPSRLI
ncbi:6352_t:CDS:10 [Paraglomus occultum]|uniref:6352_t:CDS:1 n=1 Tax=Paraglomus occultum TaxID=144539 RepID=A0A9N9A390_9GLOM|nr:6352_t:CDS:10 [Paraglomus occultum]